MEGTPFSAFARFDIAKNQRDVKRIIRRKILDFLWK